MKLKSLGASFRMALILFLWLTISGYINGSNSTGGGNTGGGDGEYTCFDYSHTCWFFGCSVYVQCQTCSSASGRALQNQSTCEGFSPGPMDP